MRGLCDRIINLLPKEWQEVIATVLKNTYSTEDECCNITKEQIFIPSLTEVSGVENEGGVEGSQYEYFKNEDNRVKRVGDDTIWWWLRSPGAGYTEYVYSVNDNGSMYGSSAYDTLYVAPCFAIKSKNV